MILTVTMNPSIDIAYPLAGPLKVDDVNRVEPIKTAGGKGLNVSRVLGQLGDDVLATGLLGGRMGDFIADRLDECGVAHDFARIAGESRVCIAVLHEGNQTEFLEAGPEVSGDELAGFGEKFRGLAGRADVVTMSGSLPRGVPVDFYATLCQEAKAAGRKFLLDTSGQRLAEGIKARPDFIKPNKDEIEALRGRPVKDEADVVREVQAFLDDGIPLAVVSLGAAGSIAGCSEGLFRVTVPHIECRNPVGSGDSFVAGAAAGFARHLPVTDLLRLAAACGTANAMEEESGFVRKDTVKTLLPQITVTRL